MQVSNSSSAINITQVINPRDGYKYDRKNLVVGQRVVDDDGQGDEAPDDAAGHAPPVRQESEDVEAWVEGRVVGSWLHRRTIGRTSHVIWQLYSGERVYLKHGAVSGKRKVRYYAPRVLDDDAMPLGVSVLEMEDEDVVERSYKLYDTGSQHVFERAGRKYVVTIVPREDSGRFDYALAVDGFRVEPEAD